MHLLHQDVDASSPVIGHMVASVGDCTMTTSTKIIFVLSLAALAGFSTGSQSQPLPERPGLPERLGTPPLGRPMPLGQLQQQTYRDELQTQQRQLEDRVGPQDPGAEMEALRNQANLNELNNMDRSGR
jgi:hypothetical protein